MRRSRGHPIRLGIFEVDPSTGELRRNGMKVKLGAQSAKLLLALLEHPGAIRSRDELKHELWPPGVYVDFDHSLNKAMYALRAALGDVATNPRFIETVSGRGYRLLSDRTEESSREEEFRKQWTKSPLLVFPFAVDSGEQELSAVGVSIAAGITDALSNLAGLRVVAFSRMRAGLRTDIEAMTLARRLNARAVLIGELFREPNAYRVHVAVVCVQDGTQVWGAQFRQGCDGSDAFITEAIAQEVAKRLAIVMVPVGARA